MSIKLCVFVLCASIVLPSNQGGWDAGWEEQKHRTSAGKSSFLILLANDQQCFSDTALPPRPPTSCTHTFFPLCPTLPPLLCCEWFCLSQPRAACDETESWPCWIIGVLALQISSHSELGLLYERRQENKWSGKRDMRLSTAFIYKRNVANSSRLNSASRGGGERNELLPPLKWLYF